MPRISTKLIDEVVSQLVGEEVKPVVRILKSKKNVSETKLAEYMSCQVNETRNMLYRLQQANLVSFTKKKDEKRGWYTYYWTFNLKRVKSLVIEIKKKNLEALKQQLKYEKNNQFFCCKNGCVRLDFEGSTEVSFKCPECGELMIQDKNKARVKELKENIAQIEKELKALLKK